MRVKEKSDDVRATQSEMGKTREIGEKPGEKPEICNESNEASFKIHPFWNCFYFFIKLLFSSHSNIVESSRRRRPLHTNGV